MGSSTLVRVTRTALYGALMVGSWTATVEAQETENSFTTQLDIRMGERHFQRQCGRCHGRDGTGNDETGAPDLTTGRFQHASTPAGLFTVIREGLPGTAMIGINPGATDQTVWQLMSYLDSLNADPGDVELAGTASAGHQLYGGKGNCSSCHMVNGEGGRLGPDLSRVGERRDPDELRTDLVDPNDDVAPRWWTIRVTQQDGSVVEGLRVNEDTFSLRLIDQDENLWSFSKGQIRSYERIEDSTMPDYGQTLTVSEVDDLVAYLFSLRKES